jgi:hypothetical protein
MVIDFAVFHWTPVRKAGRHHRGDHALI